MPDDLLTPDPLQPYDAVLLVSFGGPEGPDDVLPFLRRVTAGRGIPDERLVEVGEHYALFGGRSPINQRTDEQLRALRSELKNRGSELPVILGNRNWYPLLDEVLPELAAAGHRRVLAITTSAYPSWSSCRQYRENLAAAAPAELTVERVRNYATHPGFVTANVSAVGKALSELSGDPATTRLVFVTHSIPDQMALSSGPEPRDRDGEYVNWHRHVAQAVAAEAAPELPWELAFCSRSGAPSQPWLEPDINDLLTDMAAQGVTDVVISPIGFISDHMEVVYDLDHEAAETAEELGIRMVRAATVGTDPQFIAGLADVALERAAEARGEQVHPAVLPGAPIGLTVCPANCCVNPRQPDKPAI
ncbi:ferrochelatase [Naumannella halotolerans]|uniref:ferrochelatase n=1 Tax=Naumannella halotolerans TaxID=993414 RepID=UPI001FB90147|nr:ferrochelatase [Naumannella halotolerans]